MPELLCFGEPLIGFYPTQKRSLSEPGEFRMTWGGDTSNVALAFSKLGRAAGVITKVGEDGFGRGFLRLWRENSVSIETVMIDPVHPTGMYLIGFPGDEPEFDYRRKGSAFSSISVEDVEKISLEGIRLFHVSGISQAVSTSALETSFALLHRCKEAGVKVSYDLNYRAKLWSRDYARGVFEYTIRNFVDVLSLNALDCDVLNLTGTPEELVSELIGRGPEIVVYRAGASGATIGDGEETLSSPGFNVRIVDTVGAGDTFTAALLCGLIEGMEMRKLLDFCQAAAAITCQGMGSVENQPSRKQIKQLLKEQKNEGP